MCGLINLQVAAQGVVLSDSDGKLLSFLIYLES